MYIVAAGQVAINSLDSDIKLGVGKYFGEMALLEHDGKRNADVFARTKVTCYSLTRNDFDGLFKLETVKKYQAWYRAVQEVQKLVQHSDPPESGYLTMVDHYTLLENELKRGGYDIEQESYDPTEELIYDLGQILEHDQGWMDQNGYVSKRLADERSHSGNKQRWVQTAAKMGFKNWVSVILVLSSTAVKLVDIMLSDCGGTTSQDMRQEEAVSTHKVSAARFELTEEILTEQVGCGVIAHFFAAYPTEYYDKFDYSASLVPLRLFSWVLGNSSFDSLRMNMLFLLFLGPVCEEFYGSLRLLNMFLVTALTGGLYTLCLANGAMLGADSLVYVLIAMSSYTVKVRWSSPEAEHASTKHSKPANAKDTKFPFTAIIGCLLFVGSQTKVLFTEMELDLEDGVSQTGHMVAGVVGVLSWVCLHKRKRVLKWIENDMAEKLTAEISSRRQQINQTLARKEQMLREELEPIARQWFDEVDSNGDEVRSPAPLD